MQGEVARKSGVNERRNLTGTLSNTIIPMLKELHSEDNVLQMPQLALRCAQFFHSISQYCLEHYHNYKREDVAKKSKIIKKQEKDKKDKVSRGRARRREQEEEVDVSTGGKLQPPKKPLTAYIIYFQDKKPNFVERYRTLNLSELTKLIAKQWKQLSQQQKQVYLDRAADDRKRYQEQMAQFKRLYGKFAANITQEPIQDDPAIELAIIQAEEFQQKQQEEIQENNQNVEIDEEQGEQAAEELSAEVIQAQGEGQGQGQGQVQGQGQDQEEVEEDGGEEDGSSQIEEGNQKVSESDNVEEISSQSPENQQNGKDS